MQNEDDNEPLWILIWRKGWQTQDWLTTSLFSGILLTELHKIIISVYPLYLTEVWLFLGIHSIFLISILNLLLLFISSLVLGWAIYSIHLASIAIHTFENEYQPLIDMWKVQNPIYYDLLKKIITQENFVSLSQWLNHTDIPDSIKEYLQNEEACENIEKVIYLLQLIFTSENRDTTTKQQLLELLNENFNDPSQTERIENICHLGLLLWDGAFLNSEKFLDVLKNTKTYSEYLPQLEQATQEPDLLQQLLETPKLMIYYSRCLELYPNQSQQINQIMNSLIPYFNNQFSGPIHQNTFKWLLDTYGEQPDLFIQIWQKILLYPNINFIEEILNQNKQLQDFECIFPQLFNIKNPCMDMIPCIHGMLYYQLPLEYLSNFRDFNIINQCIECCLNHYPNIHPNDFRKIIDKMDMIEAKLKKHPERLWDIINNIFHPKPTLFFKKFEFNLCLSTLILSKKPT